MTPAIVLLHKVLFVYCFVSVSKKRKVESIVWLLPACLNARGACKAKTKATLFQRRGQTSLPFISHAGLVERFVRAFIGAVHSLKSPGSAKVKLFRLTEPKN